MVAIPGHFVLWRCSMSRKPARSRRLTVESLESRAMLAGNVTVTVTDGVLNVAGDDKANGVAIRQLAPPNGPTTPWPGVRLEITGIPAVNGSSQQTTINGGASVIVEGVKNGVGIWLGGGQDLLKVVNPLPATNGAPNRAQVNLPGVVQIGLGEDGGAATLYVVNNVQVTVGMGNLGSELLMRGSQVYNLTVNGGPGPDRMSFTGLVSRGNVTINGGAVGPNDGGGDRIEIGNRYTDIRGPLTIVTKASSTIYLLGSMDKQLPASTSDWARISGPVTIDAQGLRGDLVYVVGVLAMSRLTINTADGNDLINIAGVSGDSLEIDGGAGTDDILQGSAERVSFASISVSGIERNSSGLS